MLTAPTLEKLQALKLDAMAAAWTEQQQQADLTRPRLRRALRPPRRGRVAAPARTSASTRALQEAKLKLPHACLEAIDYPARRELDKAVIRQLATCRWVQEHHNVILVGATGVGKSFVACALAHQACRKGYRAGYRRASRLFHELTLARADGTYVRLLGQARPRRRPVIDDWGLAPVQDQERRDLLEILEDRYGTRSTIITSQLPPAQWHDYLARRDPGRRDLRPPPPQRPPARAKRTLAEKGGQARRLTDGPASLRSDHDPPISLITIDRSE